MALTEAQKKEVREGFLEWSGGDEPWDFCPDDGDYGYEAYAEHYEHDGVSQEELGDFLEKWNDEGEARFQADVDARNADPVVWTGAVGAFPVRVRRLPGGASFAVETLYGDGTPWASSPGDVALRALSLAFASEIHDRGLPRG